MRRIHGEEENTIEKNNNTENRNNTSTNISNNYANDNDYTSNDNSNNINNIDNKQQHQNELKNYSGVYIERDNVRAIDFTDNEDIKNNLTDMTFEYDVSFMPSLRGSLGEESIHLSIYHKETGKTYKEYQNITPVEGTNTFTVTLSAEGMNNYKTISNSFIYKPQK